MTNNANAENISYTGYAVAHVYMPSSKTVDYAFKTATHVYIAAAKASLVANL